ncbi:MAG: hypothetical protein VKJ24_03260 [Synechococcales bacterium]|nr:hypothetical protein [Synechococcales bacterium]
MAVTAGPKSPAPKANFVERSIFGGEGWVGCSLMDAVGVKSQVNGFQACQVTVKRPFTLP